MQQIDLTDREIFAKVVVGAIQGVLTWGLAAAAVLLLAIFLPRISILAAVPLLLLFLLTALWRLGNILLGLIIEVGRAFGAWRDTPHDAKWLWAAQAVRVTESVIYLGLAVLLYRVVLAS